jgi:methylmalonyl-CoA mutase
VNGFPFLPGAQFLPASLAGLVRQRQKSHTVWPVVCIAPRVRFMSPGSGRSDPVEGGLPEPAELEPVAGSLALDLDGPDGAAATRADWEKAAAAVLRKSRRIGEGDPDDVVWARLSRTTLDGVQIGPLGIPGEVDDLAGPARPTSPGGHDIRIELLGADERRLNTEALADLEGGATSLWLHADRATDLHAVLDGVLLDLAPVVLDPVGEPVVVAQRFLDRLGDTTPAEGTNLGAPATAADEELVAVAHLALDAGVRAVVVDGSAIHDGGASDGQELGWSMAAAVRVLRVLESAGVEPERAAGLIEFRYAATDEQFPTIAKLRAARVLWSRVLQACGTAPVEQRQHAVTSRPMMSRYDPWVNMLRSTVAAFSATVGGADAVTVQPFDRPLGRPDAFGRRIARNQMHLLLSESHVGAVADPAGGAWAVERLTHDLAAAGWRQLQALEGGACIDDAIAATVSARDRQVALRTRPITGLTEFPNLAETLPEREGGPDAVRRHGAPFEALRDDPAKASVFLATLGPVAAHTARATFATNLLAAGGIGVESGTYDGQRVVCLAGAEAAYDGSGEQTAAALREAGAQRVIVAGKPRDWADDSCAMGVDALAFLTRTREALA